MNPERESPILLKQLKATGLLSFGPNGIDLPLQNLNVFIGPNGSGKSNLIELIALLQASPRSLPEPVSETGGAKEWLWKGKPAVREATVEVVVPDPSKNMDLRHVLTVKEFGNQFEVADERIENATPYQAMQAQLPFYDYRKGQPWIRDAIESDLRKDSAQGVQRGRDLDRTSVTSGQSILAQLKDPERYPALSRLQEAYGQVRIYRDWVIGPSSRLRRPQIAGGPSDVVEEDFSNYQRVIWSMRKVSQSELLEHLSVLYEGAEDFFLDALGDTVLLSVRETNVGYVPVTRLSDGTLRYLCLLAILLSPSPPPLIVIDEPDLGLHPDLMPTLARLLRRCAERTQVLVTTHSRALVDAFTDEPDVVVTCGKDASGTYFERLSAGHLAEWLERYSLGQLWSRGDLGANRW